MSQNIDEFPTIRQYFLYQNFTFSHSPICGDPARNKIGASEGSFLHC